ncbi:transposase, partial [Streptomyces sp. TRM76130]|nr:transposase [Streptomyces sp. TRM76130]
MSRPARLVGSVRETANQRLWNTPYGMLGTGRLRCWTPFCSAYARPNPKHFGAGGGILRLADEPGYRRQIEVQANLQDGRHSLARNILHGRAGQLSRSYQDGMGEQIGTLGLVVNALVL